MKVIHLSAECFPFAKVGGLADVVGALPKYQSALGIEAQVIMPLYDNDFEPNEKLLTVGSGKVSLGKANYSYQVKTTSHKRHGLEILLIDIPELLFKPFVYSSDDTERFLAFQITGLDHISNQDKLPDVIHCHDHHTGLVPFLMSYCPQFASLKTTPSILTIHNAQYQGWISYDHIDLLPSFDRKYIGLLDWNKSINSLAAAIKCAWHVTTVSMTYLEELKVAANGLELLLKEEHKKCSGILNGIDTKLWDPETDMLLTKNFKTSSAQSGKKANKNELCKKYGLNPKLPLIVFIGRLVYEKGADLFPLAFEKILNKHAVSILLLGSGNKEVEQELLAVKAGKKSTYHAVIGYDESLAHMMYAGADFLLMPSRIEPCGLNQMYALRYGTAPIVSKVGGLKDTVIDVSDKGFGICMEEVSVDFIAHAVNRALDFYGDQPAYKKSRKKIMELDHSWDLSADRYIQLYKSIIHHDQR